jgi:hypothetical protein
VQRQLAPTGGTVTGVRISCADSRVIFDTASGGHAYRMTACDIPVGDYSVGVSTKGTQVDFDFGQSAAKGQRFHFGFTVEPGQVNPATLFQGQHQVAVSVVESLPPARVAPGAAPATLVERVAAFQRLVKNAGKVRLAQNSRALEQWRQFLEKQISPAQVASQLHAEEVRSLLQTAGQGGQAELALADQWLRNRGPNRRWVQQQQIEGRYRACTGCHAAVQADAMDRDLVERGAPLQTPLEQLATAEASPRPDFAEGKRVDVAGQPGASAAVGQAQQRVNAIQPYLQQLGPSGYRVLPAETLGSTAPPSALVADISRRISQRQADYREFSRRIDAPDFDYLLLRPIVRDLLPLADADVRKAVQDAIDRAQTWEIVEKILVGIAAIGTLLLIVFPPTTGLGIAAAWALGTALSAHQVYRGLESYQQGRLLSLGRGADDVLDPAQQEAADAMMAMGALNMVLGTVGLAGSALGAVRILRSLPTGGGVGAMEAVEAEAGGQVYRVSGWGKPNPQVKVTAGNKVVYEGPVSSMPRGSGGAAQATAGATGRSGGYVFPTEGGAARVAEPMPVPVVPPQPAPVVAPTPKIPPPPDLRLPLGMSGGARGVGAVASATTDPSGEPVMPPGLSRAKKELWRACAERYKAYDATKADVAEAVANRRDLHMKVHAKKATPEEKIAYCALLQQQLEVVERLEAQRKAYMDMDCDQFDWFNRGTTPAQRLAAHRGEKNNVSASRGNLMALIHEFCP